MRFGYFPTDKRFEMYKVPTNGSYPSSIAFDSQDRVWFSEIFGKKLGVMLTRSKHPIILQMEYKNIN
jgi:streptogramin lyase